MTMSNMTNAGKPTRREKEKPQKKNAMLLRDVSMTLIMTIVTLNGKNGTTMSSIGTTGNPNST
jgi:hypothetical protein